MTLVAPPGQKGQGNDPPWRIAAKVKADYSAARLDQIEASFGPEERALKLSGNGDIRFGAAPLLRAALSARQLDADKFFTKDNAAEPVRALPALRALAHARSASADPGADRAGIRAGHAGRTPVAGYFRRSAWRRQILEPATTGVSRARRNQGFAQRRRCEERRRRIVSRSRSASNSSDPEALLTWLQGRGDTAYRSQKPLRLRGDVTVAPEGFAIDAMKADIEGGTVEGRVAVSHKQAIHGSRVEADLKAERLDLDAATAFAEVAGGAARRLAG